MNAFENDVRMAVYRHFIDRCNTQNHPVGGVLTLDTAWQLAIAWYYDRLEPSWCRKSLQEIEQLFTELGMTSSFWKF